MQDPILLQEVKAVQDRAQGEILLAGAILQAEAIQAQEAVQGQAAAETLQAGVFLPAEVVQAAEAVRAQVEVVQVEAAQAQAGAVAQAEAADLQGLPEGKTTKLIIKIQSKGGNECSTLFCKILNL